MCGIAGVVRLHGRILEQDRASVTLMLRAQAHRGPDGEDCFADERVCLGHRRLAIIDLSDNGREPMANEAGDVWVSFNGEIYNFAELRSELVASGHVFRSRTDTEVLVHGYEEWGLESLLERLRGMFAFALYDARRAGAAKLFLVRDRFGIKPLYYARRGDALWFASELTALVRSGAVAAELDDHALTSFLEYGSIPGPRTALRDTETLPAGHYVEVSGGRSSRRRYWRLGGASGDDSESIPDLLAKSVRAHLASDVPLGVFLSGGIDSATLVALASSTLSEPLKTLSVVFDDDGLNESAFARRVADRYRTDHREVFLDAEDFLETLPDIFDAMDSPTIDGVNTYFVSRAAKRAGLTVVLSGLGGDEVFLGYPHYKTLATFDPLVGLLARLPRRLRAVVAATAKAIARKDKLGYLEVPTPANVYRVFRGLFSPRQIAELVDGVEAGGPFGVDEALTHQDEEETLLQTTVRLEFEHYLQHQLLRDTDTMSMAHSIEARVPFLDHVLVEAVARRPFASKLSRRINKPLLVNALPEPLPREVWNRRKQGFTLPFKRFMLAHRDELRERARESNLFRADAVDAMWNELESGRSHWSRPWALVVFAAWNDRLRAAAVSPDEPVLATAPPR